MALRSFNGDVDVIAGLGDTPTVDDGLTTAQFKAKFDYAAGLIKTYINNTLVPYINGTLLAKITGTAGVLKTTSAGAVSAGTVGTSEITDGAVTEGKIGAGAVTASKLGSDVDFEAVGIHVVTTAPTPSSPDGIYLVTES